MLRVLQILYPAIKIKYTENNLVNNIAGIINTPKQVIKFPTVLFMNNFMRPAEYETPTYDHVLFFNVIVKASSDDPALDRILKYTVSYHNIVFVLKYHICDVQN